MSDITPMVRSLFGVYAAMIVILIFGGFMALSGNYVIAAVLFGSLTLLYLGMVKIGRELKGDKE